MVSLNRLSEKPYVTLTYRCIVVYCLFWNFYDSLVVFLQINRLNVNVQQVYNCYLFFVFLNLQAIHIIRKAA